jgi:hypothetical protein
MDTQFLRNRPGYTLRSRDRARHVVGGDAVAEPGDRRPDQQSQVMTSLVLMIENYRSGFLWRLMRNCPHIARLAASGICRELVMNMAIGNCRNTAPGNVQFTEALVRQIGSPCSWNCFVSGKR